MSLHVLDLLVIAAYVAVTIAIGFWISKRASAGLRNYFLGGNTIPWYALGISNASGMFDISGTMWLVYLLFVYGLKSIWIPWLWPVFNQIFAMVYLSAWLRRSGVMTGAEWITFRFGSGRGAHLSHLTVVAFAIINVIGLLAYGFIGIGKFAAAFLPFQLSPDPTLNAHLYGLIVTALTTLYVVKGGMYSVVFTEVLQFTIMTIACVWVGLIAIRQVSPEALAAAVPPGWSTPWFGWNLELDWSTALPALSQKIGQDGYSMFGAFFMMVVLKGTLQGGAGPAPNYDMQRILSAKSPSDAAKMSGLVSLVLMIPRYMLIAGLTVLALVFFSDDLRSMGDGVDFELVLPMAIRTFVPTGLLGLLIAALLAAFMSTYAATVNAAPAYLVGDVYKRYLNPNASERTYVWMSYAATLVVAIVGTAAGFFVESLNDIVQWIVAALYGGYTAANVLKWYWWRFNSYGYFFGMTAGILGSALTPVLLPSVPAIFAFPIVFVVSVLGCLLGTLLTPPDDDPVLIEFYIRVRPWGFWRPIHEKAAARYPDLERNRDFARDMFNVVVGIVWQTSLVAIGILIVIQDIERLAMALIAAIVTSFILKYSWYDRLRPEDTLPPELRWSAAPPPSDPPEEPPSPPPE